MQATILKTYIIRGSIDGKPRKVADMEGELRDVRKGIIERGNEYLVSEEQIGTVNDEGQEISRRGYVVKEIAADSGDGRGSWNGPGYHRVGAPTKEQLSAFMTAHGLRPDAVAEIVGVSRQTVRKYLKGESEMSAPLFHLLRLQLRDAALMPQSELDRLVPSKPQLDEIDQMIKERAEAGRG